MKNTLFLIAQLGVFALAFCFLSNFAAAQEFRVKQNLQTVISVDNYSSNISFDNAERQVFDLVNRERERQGLSILKWNGDLARLARNYSQKMADEDFFSHYDSSGAAVEQRARALNIKNWRKIGENLFESIGDRNYAGTSVKLWMKSAGHRRNILDSQFTASGIGIAQSRDGKIYITQVFIEN